MQPRYFRLLACEGLILLFLFLSFSLNAQITVDRYIGVNTLREDPIKRMKAVGFIREYHSWYLNEGNPSHIQTDFSPSYPNALYRWNTVYQDLTYTRFDEFYDEIRNTHDIQIAPAFLGNLFQIVDPARDTFSIDNHIVQEEIPIASGANPLAPNSYVAHASYLYHYAARYGHEKWSVNRINNQMVQVTHPKETPKNNLKLVEYMESWNEQDKWWWQGTNPNTYFEPGEYAAMLSADYDGHGKTISPRVGIKNADPNMKVVMGGLAEADLDYIREMVDSCKSYRSGLPAGTDTLPFQVINIHHYIGNNLRFLQSTQGINPERADLRGFLQTFDTYRDSLSAATGQDLELWLSEFGYDTYGPSSTGNPVVIAPEIGPNDSYEVQGQWITRIYLEGLAADIDRAMLFFLRDEQTPYAGLYTSSGLLENAANNYKPKNSWFYVYTMKNILKDMVFEADMSPCGDTTCARIYKFTEVNNGNKEVYAIWSPTSTANTFDFYWDDATMGSLNGACQIEMELPSIWGVSTDITVDDPMIPVRERPIFIVKTGNPFVGQTCVANPTIENPTCSSLNVRLNAPNGSGTYQLWYMQGNFIVDDFSHRLATLVDENLISGDSVITVANLHSNQPYTFFLFPEGVGRSETNKICTITGATNGNTCKIVLDPNWVFDEYKNTINPGGLFDNQNLDPMCNPNESFPGQSDLWGFNYDLTDSLYVSIDLQAYYYIDALSLHDEGSRGYFTIQTADSPNGPWETALDYLTVDYNVWKTLTNVFPAYKPIRYLRFIGEKNDAAKVGELFICGRLSNYNPDILPGIGVNGLVKNISCNNITLEWNHPLDNDIQSYKIIRNGTLIATIPFSPETPNFPNSELNEGTAYKYAIVTVDMVNQESEDSLKLMATTVSGIDECKIPLNTSMIFDHYFQLGNAQKLIDEQNAYDPICDPNTVPTDNFWGADFSIGGQEQVSLDLQAYYTIEDVYLHDGGGINGKIKVFKSESPNGPWVKVIDYDAVKFGDWIHFSNPTSGEFIRYLRIEASADDNVATGEMFICGTEQTGYNPDIKSDKGNH